MMSDIRYLLFIIYIVKWFIIIPHGYCIITPNMAYAGFVRYDLTLTKRPPWYTSARW